MARHAAALGGELRDYFAGISGKGGFFLAAHEVDVELSDADLAEAV